MSRRTGIEWTDGGATWNPWYGCAKVSAECDNCYMFTEMRRYGHDPEVVTKSKINFDAPLKWKKSGNQPKFCFTCSWSDWFIRDADGWRNEAWEIVRRTPETTYQILTKRAGRILDNLPEAWESGWPNVWLGVSVGVKATRQRISTLRKIPAVVRFVSFEPLLEDLEEVNLDGIQWAIIGGESGPKAREFNLHWFDVIQKAAEKSGTKLFVKQIGAKPTFGGIPVESKGKGGDMLYWPEYLRIREYPAVQP